ncbi:MAG TPA: hypothetical protein VF720_01840 [Candidatus Eisenbacteria bacterium]
MMLKRIAADAIPAALARAERYRLLNQARQAESICRDVLEVDPNHGEALVLLLLSLTDCFADEGAEAAHADALALLPKLSDGYARDYYQGLIVERWALALAGRAAPTHLVADWIHRAMASFEKAEAQRPAGNDEALLRWNACARLLGRLSRSGSAGASHQAAPADRPDELDTGDDPPG